MDKDYDFSGWATRNDIRCSDGRIIRKDAFKNNDGETVPLVWNHSHREANNILGHALLENRDEGVYVYGKFNETKQGKNAKELVKHGDITSLSIWANRLQQKGSDVLHGAIREVSLVLAGANPGAYIDSVMAHGEVSDEEAIIYSGENLVLSHSDENENQDENTETLKEVFDTLTDKQKNVVYGIIGSALADDSDEEIEHAEAEDKTKNDDNGETVLDVFNTLNEKQKTVVYYIIGKSLEENQNGKAEKTEQDKKDSKGGNEEMKHNLFDREEQNESRVHESGVLSHAEQEDIINIAKRNSVGSLQDAIALYFDDNESLAHGIDEIENLFPEYKDVRPGAPEFIQRDQGWVNTVMSKVHKSPISRIRTRQADIRGNDLRAKGYRKGKHKELSGNIKLLSRTTDPQTVYRKDALHRDDIVDITDFDVVEYQYQVMKQNLNEDIALAIMIGDGRDDGDEDKIYEDKIRPIWKDDDLYTIHSDVNIEQAKKDLQGTNTSLQFGENYVYAEAIITAALYAREKYKGSGNLDFYCTPHLLNVMLLARDLNGRRIYNSVNDIAAALNVSNIYTAEQFENQIRTDKESHKHKLLGLFVNLKDYHVGSTKGGEITRFNQFDIDFNQEKYLIETRLSGALTRVYSAIALEEPADQSF